MMTRRRLLQSTLLLSTSNSLISLLAHAQAQTREEPVAGDEKQPAPRDAVAQGATAQKTVNRNAPWLEEIARQMQVKHNLPAIWVAANIEDHVEAAVLGVRKAGDPTSATLNDLLTIDSLSKPMVGLWLATLVERGRLSYETKLLDVMPELRAKCLPEHRDIALGHLVTHTSGLVSNPKDVVVNANYDTYPQERLRQTQYAMSVPGAVGLNKEAYGDEATTLAVALAERSTGENYETAAGRFYREILGLKSWGVWPMTRPDDLSIPWPHELNGTSLQPKPPSSVAYNFAYPGKSAHCNIRDLVRFGLISTNATAASRTLLKPEDWASVMLPVPNTTFVLTCFHVQDGGSAFFHSGSLGTTHSHLLVIPEWKACFAFHTNAALSGRASWETIDLIQDAFRKRRAALSAPSPCALAITSVQMMDETWQKVTAPKITDRQIRVQVRLEVEAPLRTGDLKTLVKLGDMENRDNRYQGLTKGEHTLNFSFDTPKLTEIPLTVTLDSLGTAGNLSPQTAHYSSMLTLT